MHRQFILLTLVMLVVLLPLRVAATALGDMRIYSSPEQALLAEAEIYDPGSHTLNDFKVEILPSLTGATAYPLSALRSEIIPGQGGRLLLRLRSDQPIHVKTLALRLALSMPGQRLIRTYELRQVGSLSRSAPVYPDREVASPAGPKPAIAGTYTVKPGDTLWRLARQLRPHDGISIPNMLKALYEANPQAFTAGDIDRLKLGARLSVPALGQAIPAITPASVHPQSRQQVTQAASPAVSPEKEFLPDATPVTTRVAPQQAMITPADLQRSAAALAENTRAMRDEVRRMNARISALRERLERNDDQVRKLSARLEQKSPAPLPVVAPVVQPATPARTVSLSPAIGQGTTSSLSLTDPGFLLAAAGTLLTLILLWLGLRGIARHLSHRRGLRELESQEAVMLDIVSQKADERLRKEALLLSGSYSAPENSLQSGQVVQLDHFRSTG